MRFFANVSLLMNFRNQIIIKSVQNQYFNFNCFRNFYEQKSILTLQSQFFGFCFYKRQRELILFASSSTLKVICLLVCKKCKVLTFIIAVQMNINMNFSQASNRNQSSIASENDLQKLMNICNSYGLNEEETNQIISQFRRGALYSQPSLNDSLTQSLGEMTFSEKQQEEEYSFKHGKNTNKQEHSRPQFIKLQEEDYRENEINETGRESVDCEPKGLQKLLYQKLSIEKGLIYNIQEENQSLKKALQEKDSTIQNLIDMKRQDADIIMGLKDIITNLTMTLRQKQTTCKDLHQKYSQFMESRFNQLSQRKSTLDFSESSLQEVSNSIGNRKESKPKQNNLESKDTKTSTSMEMSNVELKKPKQPNRIDIKKYKEMIENMRNNY